jgi:glucose/arabinose dehydrogenase
MAPKLVLALAAVASLACSSTPRAPNCVFVEEGFGPPGTVPITVETIVAGLEVPWSLAFLPDGGILLTVRPGRVLLVRDGAIEATVAQVPIAGGGEGGLLGLVLAPDFETSRAFFLYYTADDGNRLERWTLDADAHGAALERVLLQGIPAAPRHDGGRLRIGPDGMLYVGTGDAAEPDLSQDTESLAGKILRLSPEGPGPESPIFVTGIRNTQGFDWLDDGALVVTDHGPSGELGREGMDEISVAAPGANLGWPILSGCDAKEGLVSPVLSFVEAVPPGGAAIYRGTAIPEWRGDLLVGVLGSKHLHRVKFAADRSVAAHEVYLAGDPPSGFGRLRDVVMGPDEELYATTSNCDGRGNCPADGDRILRITRR